MNTIAAELAQTELFQDVPDTVLRMVVEHSAPRDLAAGGVLLAPGRANHHVYLLLSGTLGLHFESRAGAPGVLSAEIERNARVLMRGSAFVNPPEIPGAGDEPERTAIAELLEA